ncbi:hypothetical protein RvY_09787 [Ramazzottius varieornatus]|uniref:Uncharacterized protein n=1 Tax=Ramazzottius varieornatus TaxID=947166 RepID=A0A1D1VAK0_RAMVA|nr:hypothetical protein RvY_09787 [Ramazzottius varieornatus]
MFPSAHGKIHEGTTELNCVDSWPRRTKRYIAPDWPAPHFIFSTHPTWYRFCDAVKVKSQLF